MSYLREQRGLVGRRLLLVPSVAAIIHDGEGRLLLHEKASGEGWSLPAGAMEPGETPQEAVTREVREETGLVVTPAGILGVFGGHAFRHIYPNGDEVEYVVTVFQCAVVEAGGRWTDAETRALGYFTRETLPPLTPAYPLSVLFPAS